MAAIEKMQPYSNDFVNRPKLFNLKLNSLQNMHKTLSGLRPINRFDADYGDYRENEHSMKSSNHKQIGRFEHGNSSFWVSMLS